MPGMNLDVMKERIQAALPEGYYVDTPMGRSRQMENTTQRFRKSMGLVSFMALFVGMYLIYNTVAISVVQRRKEIGIIRAVGGTRGQVVGLFLGETALLAALASLLGIGLGILFAKLTVGAVSQTITDTAVRATVTELAFSWSSFFFAAGVGMAASLVAALLPVVKQHKDLTDIRHPKRTVFRRRDIAGKHHQARLSALSSGGVVTFLIYNNADASSDLRSSSLIFVTMALVLLGISLTTPMFLKRFMRAFHDSLASRFGASGRLAGLNLQKNISRNSVAVAAVFFGIALSVGSAGLVHSMRTSLYEYIESIINADLLISSGNGLSMGSSSSTPLPFEMVKDVEKVPGILFAEPFRKVYAELPGP